MNTKLYVLGAVLGAAPGLLPEASPPSVAPPQESRPDSRGASRKGRGGRSPSTGTTPAGNHAVVAPPPEVPEKHEAPLVVIPEEGHWLIAPSLTGDVAGRVLAWIEEDAQPDQRRLRRRDNRGADRTQPE